MNDNKTKLKVSLRFFVSCLLLSATAAQASSNNLSGRLVTSKSVLYVEMQPQGAIQDTLRRFADSLRTKLNITFRQKEAQGKTPTLFGVQRNADNVQAKSVIGGEELRSFPTPQVGLMLYGKLPGLLVRQSGFQIGSDEPNLLLRGVSPLIVIDGVPRSYLSIDPEQIETITVIKDALGTALYGMQGNNGVLQITTRRGANKKKEVRFTSQYGIQENIFMPKSLDAYNYASLFNEALANDGRAPIYSAADLEAYRTGTDPFKYPNVDWTDRLLKSSAPTYRHNLNISGGSNTARYFVDLDYLQQDGYLVTDPATNTYDTNNSFNRISFRTNVDIDLTATTLLGVNLFGRLREGNQPGATSSSIYSAIRNTPNNAYPIFNADGSLGGNFEYQNNLYGQSMRSGYRQNYNRNLGVDVSLQQKLDILLEGLYARGKMSLNTYYDQAINRSKTFAVYMPVANSNPVTYRTIGSNAAQVNTSTISSQNRQIFSQFDVGYDKSVGSNKFVGQLLYTRNSYVSGNSLSEVNQAIGGRFNLNHSDKYLLEASASYMGFDRYKPGKQWGFFPSVGLGWNISNEEFFKELKNTFSDLKLRGSYGLTGSYSNAGYFDYLQNYVSGSSYYTGATPTANSTIVEDILANPNLTWEKAKKINIGFDAGMLKNKLWVTADYYINNYNDLMQTRNTNYSSVIGATLPMENIGERRYSGFELSVGHQNEIGKLKYFVTVNGNLAASKVLYMDEPARRSAYEYRTGMPVGQLFGYVANGFYRDAADIQNSPRVEGYNPVPGDLKYKDLNGDNVINTYDQTALGSTKPVFYYGITGGFNISGFDLSFTLNGVANTNAYYNLSEFSTVSSAGGYGQAFEQHLQRWTPATAASAQYPRLTVGGNPNNSQTSSFWVKNGSYLRLRNVELGYSLPSSLTKRVGLQQVRLFANGLNLLTFSSSDLKDIDPEVLAGTIPNQRVYNFGINIQF